MERVHRLPSGRVVRLTLRSADTSRPSFTATVHHDGDLSANERQNIRGAVTHMFRLDEDLSDFYALCAERGGRWSAVTEGRGRLLRSPTVFEDVVKTICTTNIQWSGTKRMVRELVDAFGAPYPGDATHRAFPFPEALAATSRDAFTEAVNLGYRAPYVHELAQRVARGDLDLEALSGADQSTAELKRTLLSIKGVGHYAAATLLMLLGRYDELAVDSVFRQFVSARYFDGETPSDADAKAVYDDWGQWKYLAYWFDLWEGSDESV
jgi:3-methyladenine DNA glycosylase/8-oxoguanine DNA glycosylase